MATFRPKATFRKLGGGGGGGGGYVATGPNLSISNRCDFDRFFRVTTCQQPRRPLHVSSRRRRRPASEHSILQNLECYWTCRKVLVYMTTKSVVSVKNKHDIFCAELVKMLPVISEMSSSIPHFV